MHPRRRSIESFGFTHVACCVALLLVGACVGEITEIERGAGKGGEPDGGSPSIDVDARPPAGPETECDDQIDDDGDGAVDCADSDCAGAVQCSWPTAMQMDLELDYQASSLAKLGGYDDCVTRIAAPISASGEPACATCDRAYRGPYTYVSDSCPAAPRPTEGAYALRFASDTEREVHVLDDAGVWQLVGMATGSGGVYTLTRTDPVDYEGSDAGDLTTRMTFTDAP